MAARSKTRGVGPSPRATMLSKRAFFLYTQKALLAQEHWMPPVITDKSSSAAAPLVNAATTSIAPIEVEPTDFDFQALVHEYQSLRTQIAYLMSFEVQIVNFSLILIGITIAALTQKSSIETIKSSPTLLLLASMLFLLIGLMHLYEKYRIFKTAGYIDVIIKSRFVRYHHLVDPFPWESYLEITNKTSIIWRLLSHMRSSIFWVPALVLAASFFYVKLDQYSIFEFLWLFAAAGMFLMYLVSYSLCKLVKARDIAVQFNATREMP